MSFLKLFFVILGLLIVVPFSFILLRCYLWWGMVECLEFSFIPFRWREGNYGLLLLPGVTALVLWLAFWIALGVYYWEPFIAFLFT